MRPDVLQVAPAETSVGLVLVAGSAKGVCAALLGDDAAALRADLQRRFPGAELRPGDAAFQALAGVVAAFIDAPATSCDIPLDLRGTAFQRQVWRALQRVPAGTTTTYQELAARIGRPQASRAVGQAVGANPVAVLIPCHRVLRSDGGLSGFRWGVERKRQLLAREGVSPPARSRQNRAGHHGALLLQL